MTNNNKEREARVIEEYQYFCIDEIPQPDISSAIDYLVRLGYEKFRMALHSKGFDIAGIDHKNNSGLMPFSPPQPIRLKWDQADELFEIEQNFKIKGK